MNFPHQNFDHQGLDNLVKNIIESHDKPSYSIPDKAVREIKEESEGGVEIKKYEIPFMQRMIIDRVKNIEKETTSLQSSIENHTVANLTNAQEKLDELKKEEKYLTQNFAEKFFKQEINN